ncbi:MAG: electron transport complex subunit RsxB [Paraburkholderia sp.]|nr:MAG: electron transport complex subunit RsxB [Paraburkholderia sp.]
MTDRATLADRIEDLLPQTQCTKCGYAGCRPYAEAIAQGEANYNQCPPGGAQGIARLAAVLGKRVIALNPENGAERPRALAVIDESLCIGCTLCMQACPVDAIVGAPKLMHTVLAERCTGCDLCVAPCPVDCIAMVPVTGDRTGWDAWSQGQADAARERHRLRAARLERERQAAQARAAARRAEAAASAGAAATATAPASPAADDEAAKKRAIIQAALERARQKKEALAAQGLGPSNVPPASADEQQGQASGAQAHGGATRASGDTPGPEAPSERSNATGAPTGKAAERRTNDAPTSVRPSPDDH